VDVWELKKEKYLRLGKPKLNVHFLIARWAGDHQPEVVRKNRLFPGSMFYFYFYRWAGHVIEASKVL
jgi:hypothetical protein